ncbi:GWxTD domain-containing protein [bacterium]|nr:GWxTD domain-containing protein [bacterium]
MKKLFLTVLTFCTLSVSNAQELSKYLDVDYAMFRLADGWTLTEIYYSYPRTLLAFTEMTPDSDFVAKYELTIKVTKKDSVLVNQTLERTSYNNFEIPKPYLSNQKIYDLIKLNLPVGTYTFTLKIKDLTSGNFAIAEIENKEISFEKDKLSVSSLILTEQIQKTTDSEKTIFSKNGYEVVPNSSKIYSENKPVLTVYSEIYNLDFSKNEGEFTVQYFILDTEGKKIIKEFPKRTKKKIGTSSVEIQKISLVDSVVTEKVFNNKTQDWDEAKFYKLFLQTGSYNLMVSAEDLQTNKKIVAKKMFFIHNQRDKAKANKTVFSDSEYLKMSEKELDDEFAKLTYLVRDEEKKAFPKLILEAKQKFFPAFWKKTDPTPDTPYNEFEISYKENLKFVQENFTSNSRKLDGYKTDRGRIYLTYGKPSEIQQFDNDSSSHPYQIWNYYDVQGGVTFVFVDKTNGLKDYRLVHSDARGEFPETDWYRKHVVVSANPYSTPKGSIDQDRNN